MNKTEYLEKLNYELKQRKVKDIEEIIREYDDHFAYKMKQGKTEEEIANKLADPALIAREFAEDKDISNIKFQKVAVKTGIVFIDIIVLLIAILLFSWVLVIGVFSLSVLIIGLMLVLNLNIENIIPYIPYYGKVLFSISCFGLSILSVIGTKYSYDYIRQWINVYLRWHKNVLDKGIHPQLSLSPEMRTHSYTIKLTAMISLVIFGVFLILSMITSMVSAQVFEFWHEWNWFQ